MGVQRGLKRSIMAVLMSLPFGFAATGAWPQGGGEAGEREAGDSESLDLFRIDIDDRITVSESLQSVNLFTNAIDTSIRSLQQTPASLRAIVPQVQLFQAEAINVQTTASPEHQAVLTGTWSAGPWHTLLRVRHYGSVYRDRGFAAQTFGADTLVDATVEYALSDHWSVTVGADNLFDRLSDPSGASLDFGGNFAYEVLPPAGANGRFVHLEVDYQY